MSTIGQYNIAIGSASMDSKSIHAYLTTAYWSKGITQNAVHCAIENSLCFGVFLKAEQVGFARVITDYATFAYLADVYILSEHREQGLSKVLMKTVFDHPKLQGLRRMILATRDAHGLYRKFGFTALTDSSLFMERWDPDVYKNNVN